MKDYIPYWKELAHDKAITVQDTINYCLLKALRAKNPDKLAVAVGVMQQAFTPVTNFKKLINGQKAYQGLYKTGIAWSALHPSKLRDCALETEEEHKDFNKLWREVFVVLNNELAEYYTYIIVRQDISHEQQLVQAAHATLKLGASLIDSPVGLNNLNFVVCGVKNEDEVRGAAEYLYSSGYDTVEFREPDINDEVTAIASFPIKSTKKRFMKRYKILWFK